MGKNVEYIHAKLDGEVWQIRLIDRKPQKGSHNEGVCDWEAKQITIYLRGVEDKKLTMIHEAMHAACPYLSEDEVERASRVLRDLEKALGDDWGGS